MIFGINTTRDISKLSQITYNNFEISLVVFMPNITTNHAITYTNSSWGLGSLMGFKAFPGVKFSLVFTSKESLMLVVFSQDHD